MNLIKPMMISGMEVLPIIEGGKGIAVSTGATSGAFAAAGAVGTISGTIPDSYDENGNYSPPDYSKDTTRSERVETIRQKTIDGIIAQAKKAFEISNGKGRIHLNMLWEAAATPEMLEQVLPQVKQYIHGVTCGAGMPFDLGKVASANGLWYYPIVSSARAFQLLWRRSYKKYKELLGGVVYEDPWHAGGHNGLSNQDLPDQPQDPLPRIIELRETLNSFGLDDTPIIMAGKVWYLRDWKEFIDNDKVGKIAFQFGTRPMLTAESEIPDPWKQMLLNSKEGDILLHKFSPTGFYSSALKNDFLNELVARSQRQAKFSRTADAENGLTTEVKIGVRNRSIFTSADDATKIQTWKDQGFTTNMPTPDETMVFVTPETAVSIKTDQNNCMGCLSHCLFSNWKYSTRGSTGRLPDPRSFCIQKSLQNIAHTNDVHNNLAFSGTSASNFSTDPLFNQGTYPTIATLIKAIIEGN